MKLCPDCAEQVQDAANVCRYCGHKFTSERPASKSARPGGCAIAIIALIIIVWIFGRPSSQNKGDISSPTLTAPATQTFTDAEKERRLKGCQDGIADARRLGLIIDQPAQTRIGVDESLWSQMEWRHKEILMSCLAVVANGGGDMGDTIVTVYGAHSGKDLAGGSPGQGYLAPN